MATKRSLRVATAVRYNYYVQLAATRRNWMRVATANLAKRCEIFKFGTHNQSRLIATSCT